MTAQAKLITNLQPAIKELHRAFDKANAVLFKGKLPEVVITMQSRGNRKNNLGWFTVNPAWESGENEYHEINISPEAMNRDYMEILTTLVHEMIHLYCHVNNIKDTSRGNSYHNKRFLQAAIEHGFEFNHDAPDSKIGYSMITFTKQTENMVKFWNIDKSAFSIARKDFSGNGKTKKKSNIVKWECPCGTIVRSSKPEINIVCMDCGGKFEQAE